VESSLRLSPGCYETSQLFCTSCERALPEQAKKCHPYRNTDLPQKYCTSETRVAKCFAVLRRAELWPTTTPFRKCSISDIVYRFAYTKCDLKHSCTAGTYCPLRTKLNALSEMANQIKDGIGGFCLRCIIEDDEWEESDKCVHEERTRKPNSPTRKTHRRIMPF
jgi:hypothetical protein